MKANYFLIALQFLTILPIKIQTEAKKEDFGKSLLYFPIIGLLIGFLLALTLFILGFLPDPVKAAFILIISIIITGGIHLDGFADTCDGFYGNKSKEKILEIMRDSRIGVMGVTGILSLLLLKFSLIIAMPRDILWKSLIMMATFARYSQAVACYRSDYVRTEGKAKYFIAYAGRKEVLAGGLFTLALFALLMQLKGVVLFFVSLALVFLLIRCIKKKIGGMTGDTIGAVSEITETAALFFVLLSFSLWN